jgi:M6 family metalloprotease-like protein
MMTLTWYLLTIALAMASNVAARLQSTTPSPGTDSEKILDGSKTPVIQLSQLYNATFEVTVDGYTVSKIDGNYTFLEFDEISGKLVSSGLIAGIDDPETAMSMASGRKLKKKEHLKTINKKPDPVGNKKMLMVPFKFLDHLDRDLPSTEDLTILMNHRGSHPLCPTGSVRDYFLTVSYRQFVLDSTVAPWVTLPNTEAHYGAGTKGMGEMGKTMIKDALNALEATGFDFTLFDTDNDDTIDAIGFLHSGYDATNQDGDFLNRIWSHRGDLPKTWTSKSGKKVFQYHVTPSLWGSSGNEIGRIGVIVHETAHFFGLKDVYDTDGSGSGLGNYCLMGGGSNGFDGTQYYPSHLSAWSKIQAGWVEPTIITHSGKYKAHRACTHPNVFKISKNFPSGEYLLIENRQKCKYDVHIPGPGLAIYHIDESAAYTEGFPGQTGWPQNGNHYRVALLQADGLYDLEKGKNSGDETDLFGATVKSIGPSGTSAGTAYPNTNAYKGGNIRDTCITIKNIGDPSKTMTFDVHFQCK